MNDHIRKRGRNSEGFGCQFPKTSGSPVKEVRKNSALLAKFRTRTEGEVKENT
jgi:hypothetical protein